MDKTAYCVWHDRQFQDVAEHEQDACEGHGLFCTSCQFFSSIPRACQKTGNRDAGQNSPTAG